MFSHNSIYYTHVLWLLAWSMQSTGSDIRSIPDVGQSLVNIFWCKNCSYCGKFCENKQILATLLLCFFFLQYKTWHNLRISVNHSQRISKISSCCSRAHQKGKPWEENQLGLLFLIFDLWHLVWQPWPSSITLELKC